jgi:CBS domain-containing protein
MRPGIIYCPPDSPLTTVARVMAANHIHSVVITAGGDAPVGIVTERELVAAARPGAEGETADTVAADPVTVFADDPLSRAVDLMAERGATHLLVVDPSGRPVGVLSAFDVTVAVARERL